MNTSKNENTNTSKNAPKNENTNAPTGTSGQEQTLTLGQAEGITASLATQYTPEDCAVAAQSFRRATLRKALTARMAPPKAS